MRVASQRRQRRSVPFVYGGTAAAILLVVAALALVVTPPGPPAVAEFAPRAEDRIDEALKAQSSSFGTGEGGACGAGQQCEDGGSGGSTGTTTTTRPPGSGGHVDETRVRRCVGDPPRQTEDPQSPPCLNYFEGDNGGSTYKGITQHEIRVAVPQIGPWESEFAPFVEHFNRRYELYGRKIRLVTVPYDYQHPSAAVTAADEEAKAFAYLFPYRNSPDVGVMQREAARRKILSVVGFFTHSPSTLYRDKAPYLWSYAPAADEAETEVGDFACTSLAGKTAAFAGPGLQQRQRRFAVLRQRSEGDPLDVSALNASLARCQVPAPLVIDVKFNDSREEVARAELTLRDAGITSLFVFSSTNDTSQWARYLSGQYEPEWIVSGLGWPEQEPQWGTVMPAQYRRSMFGAFGVSKLLPGADTPSWWAFKEGNPDGGGTEVGNGESTYFHMAYRTLLLLASGIQMAGPRLTPETFSTGLHKAQFPNPGAGARPFYQSHVGFGPGDYAMTHGSAVVWWSDSAPTYSGNGVHRSGGWCYVERGRRFSGNWTDVSGRLFDPDPRNCR